MVATGREKTFVAGETLAAALRVKFSAGTVVKAGANDIAIGVVKYAVSSGDRAIVELISSQGTMDMTASDSFAKYALVYGAASGKVTGTANSNLVGVSMEASGGDGSVVEVLPLFNPNMVASANVAASAAITATSGETAFDKSYSIAANTLAAGDHFKVRAQGIITAQNASDTLIIRSKIGSVEIVSTGAIEPVPNDIWVVEYDLIVRTIGASGTIVAAGTYAIGTVGTVTAKPFLKASATLDTTAASNITVTAQWSSADAGNSTRLDVLSLQHFSLNG